MSERVIWNAAAVAAGLEAATRVVRLWSAGQQAPNHHQRKLMGMSPEQRARRVGLIVPSAEELRAAEAVLACLSVIEDPLLRRLVQARATGASWARLEAIDGERCGKTIQRRVEAAYRKIAIALNNPVEGEGSSVHAAVA